MTSHDRPSRVSGSAHRSEPEPKPEPEPADRFRGIGAASNAAADPAFVPPPFTAPFSFNIRSERDVTINPLNGEGIEPHIGYMGGAGSQGSAMALPVYGHAGTGAGFLAVPRELSGSGGIVNPVAPIGQDLGLEIGLLPALPGAESADVNMDEGRVDAPAAVAGRADNGRMAEQSRDGGPVSDNRGVEARRGTAGTRLSADKPDTKK
jgi:hypothetical protein